jgi:transcriptional regulator with XRE-family HTH domain
MAKRSTPEHAEAESARIAELLRELLEVREVSIRSVEEALGWGGGMLNRILSGATSLRMAHVLAVLEVLDYPAAQFFADAFGEPKKREAPGGEGGGGEIVPGLSRDMLRREIAAALQRMPKAQPKKGGGGKKRPKKDRLHRSVIGG